MPEGIVINYMFDELMYNEDFNAVKALFTLKKGNYNYKSRLGYMPQTQICIKNQSLVKNIKEYDFSTEKQQYNKVILEMNKHKNLENYQGNIRLEKSNTENNKE